MTLDEWQKAIDRVTMHRIWPMPIVQRVSHSEHLDAFAIYTKLSAPCVDTGDPQVVTHLAVAPDYIVDPDDAVDFLARQIKKAVEHEIDECLLVDGRKLRDPHARSR